MASDLGPLGAYERNLRLADEDLIKQGNYTEVPSIDVLKNARHEYGKRYELDEDMFKAVRLLRYMTYQLDDSSKDVQGKVLL